MAWLHEQTQRRMQARLERRILITKTIAKNVRYPGHVEKNRRLAMVAFESADTDPFVFKDWFGEPLPLHWQTALSRERDLWVAIIHTLEGVARAPRDELLGAAPALRGECAVLQRLLELETQMLYSPLQEYFTRAIEEAA